MSKNCPPFGGADGDYENVINQPPLRKRNQPTGTQGARARGGFGKREHAAGVCQR